MSLLTLFHRSDTHTINGLNANKLLTSRSGSAQDVEIFDDTAATPTLRTTVSIYIRKADNSETLIGSADIGQIDRACPGMDDSDEGIQSVQWLCPETALDATDALKIVEKIQFVGTAAVNTKTFVTEQLNTTRLNASVWTFYRYTYHQNSEDWEFTGRLYYDTATYNTRVEGISIGGTQFTDAFTRADSATVGNDWTENNSSTHEILSNKVRSTAVGGTTFDTNQLLRPSSEYFYNGIISVDFQYIDSVSNGGIPGITARTQGSDDQLYACYVLNQVFYINKRITGSVTVLAASSTLSLSTGTNYRIVFTLDGSNLYGALYNVDSSTIVATISATDSTLTSGGKHGISRNPSGSLIDYDNFSAARDATLLSVTDSGSGSDAVTVAASASIPDAVTGSDAIVIAVGLVVTDSGTGLDTVDTGGSAAISAPDTGDGSDSVTVAAALAVSDTAKGRDFLVVDPSNLYLLERFDGSLDAWNLDQSGGTVSIQTADNDEKMVLSDSSSSGVVSATRGIIEPDGVYLIEADMYAAAGAIGYLELLDGAENVVASVKCDGGAEQGTFDTDAATASAFD
ncbi:MAG: hypothetical protein A2054_01350 [Deltaproteobacteria bacterium GWA2_55_10]|nr:MAG: hypothetical protein A2054_01350 [Deltaproteobacteria bacterium GWA2_55_10]